MKIPAHKDDALYLEWHHVVRKHALREAVFEHTHARELAPALMLTTRPKGPLTFVALYADHPKPAPHQVTAVWQEKMRLGLLMSNVVFDCIWRADDAANLHALLSEWHSMPAPTEITPLRDMAQRLKEAIP